MGAYTISLRISRVKRISAGKSFNIVLIQFLGGGQVARETFQWLAHSPVETERPVSTPQSVAYQSPLSTCHLHANVRKYDGSKSEASIVQQSRCNDRELGASQSVDKVPAVSTGKCGYMQVQWRGSAVLVGRGLRWWWCLPLLQETSGF